MDFGMCVGKTTGQHCGFHHGRRSRSSQRGRGAGKPGRFGHRPDQGGGGTSGQRRQRHFSGVAGEQGRGFAVVADEVRKLAERTAGATTEITVLIGAIRNEVGNAVTDMGNVGLKVGHGFGMVGEAANSLATIQENAEKSAAAVADIAAATREQNSTSFEITQDVEKVETMTDQNVMAIGTTAESAQQLKKLAEDLKNAVGRLKV